jgi:hypothetical protein
MVLNQSLNQSTNQTNNQTIPNDSKTDEFSDPNFVGEKVMAIFQTLVLRAHCHGRVRLCHWYTPVSVKIDRTASHRHATAGGANGSIGGLRPAKATQRGLWCETSHAPPAAVRNGRNIRLCVLSEFSVSSLNQMSCTEEKDPIGYWRLDAAASFSDFVIVVREEDEDEDSATKKDEDSSAEDTTTRTYHVHRS